jgi:hypothetical protein
MMLELGWNVMEQVTRFWHSEFVTQEQALAILDYISPLVLLPTTRARGNATGMQ